MHLNFCFGQAPVGDACPKHRVHLGHVRAPQHEGVGLLDVVVTAHRFVDAKAAHEAGDCRSHAVARVRVDVVGAEAGLVQLGRRVALPDGVLPRGEDADAARTIRFQGGFPLLGHDVKGLVPGDRGKFAILVVLAVFHAQHWLGQAIFAVHDFRQEIAFDAVEAAIDFRIRIALGGHHAPVLNANQHGAAGAAKAADALVPAHRRRHRGIALGGLRRQGNASAGRGGRNGLRLDEIASIDGHDGASWQGWESKWSVFGRSANNASFASKANVAARTSGMR